MEKHEPEKTYQFKIAGYIYLIAPEGDHFRLSFRKKGGYTYEDGKKHSTIESAREQIRLLSNRIVKAGLIEIPGDD